MLSGMHSARRSTKGVEGRDWEELYEHYKEMSRAAGVRKPNEAQKKKRKPSGK